ncbi:MAG: hypothetical protein PHE79_09865 [Eubacteriales bacterium]|nr:hypothetical protein [Eubacteriales bacterium]
MRKHYKLFIFPALIVIIAGIFSGFSEQSYTKIAESLLEERTTVLQMAYSGRIELDEAEEVLKRIETYPLLSEDIAYLRTAEPTEIDIVKSMEFVETHQKNKLFGYVSLNTNIRWNMSGLSADYISDNEYSVILKSTKSGYKLSEFNPI